MKGNDWPVDKYGIRPAGKPDECFYCHEKVGTQHKSDCVIRSRTVVIELKLPLVVSVPEKWDVSNIEFKYGESSYCMNNIQDNIDNFFSHLNTPNSQGETPVCLCGVAEVSYLREATEDDEEYFNIKVEDLPT